MKKLYDYKKIGALLNETNIEKVYPLSIAEGYQSGEIFVDDIDKPAFVLFWHYCGFAFLAGLSNDNLMNEVYELMKNPMEGHHNRMIIQAVEECGLPMRSDILKHERYIFSFDSLCEKVIIPADLNLCQITYENYDLIKGNIIPGFSWTNKEEFLKNGFGYCLMRENEVLACAFSAAVSDKYVDIGIETNEKYRGNGYAKMVAAAMAEEIIKKGKTPAWACDTRNEGSMRVACAIGFRIEGMHPYFRL